MAFLEIRNLRKRFGEVVAVDGVTLDVERGEFFTLLGPSGCGKSTTLRLVGGLEKPDAGEIRLEGRCLASAERGIFVKPEKREMGMVFQSYALWPHMTVFENVAYPLRLRWMKREEIREKVEAVLELVGLRGLEERPAPTLSGGQQQRVALARALVFSPGVLLLDEPLSNLDAQLRDEMRQELKSLQRRVAVTVLFVTHDQIEALSLSDRVAILRQGRVEQVGTPEEVYYRPATPFVRDFLGKTFALTGRLARAGESGAEVVLNGCAVVLRARAAAAPLPVGEKVMVAVRPEKIGVWREPPPGERNLVAAALESAHFLGDRYEYTVRLGEERRVLVLPAAEVFRPGERLFLELKPEDITLWAR